LRVVVLQSLFFCVLRHFYSCSNDLY
jgi:hypothetical protein